MTENAKSPDTLRVADLSQRRDTGFALSPDKGTCAAIAEALGLLDLRKLGFAGKVTSEGRRDWRLDGKLGATVVQPCVATLAPVTTRIDRTVTRRYLADGLPEPVADEVEMPQDDTVEALGATIDLMALLHEELALALPDYPRSPDADPIEAAAAPSGVAPMTDEDIKPFAGLSALRDKLAKGGGED